MGISGLFRRLRRSALPAALLQGVLLVAGPLFAADSAVPVVSRSDAPLLSAGQAQYESLFACPTTLDHIGRVVVPVLVNGKGPFRFVIDTGASHSTVSPRLVHELGLTVSQVPLINLEGITGSAPVPAVMIRTLKAGSMVIRDTSVPVLETPMMAGTDGILGIAGISDISLLVDFQRNRVRIARALEPDIRFEYSRVHTRFVSGGLMAIPAYVGHVRVLAIIDTGSERTLGNPALRAALRLDEAPGQLDPVTAVYGATRQVETGLMVASPTIALGPLRVNGVGIIYGDFHIFKVWGLESRPAMILGMDVLGTVQGLGFDFGSRDLFVGGARRSGNMFSAIQSYDSAGATGSLKGIH
jgi:Aspartyl protease